MAKRQKINRSGHRPEAQAVFREFAWTLAGALKQRGAGARRAAR